MEEITETKKVTCTVCPRGCQMTVTRKGEDVTVEGATCAELMSLGGVIISGTNAVTGEPDTVAAYYTNY